MSRSRFLELLDRDGTHVKDLERKAMFYILSRNDDLYKKVNHIYDFKDHSIKPECLESSVVDLCSSSRRLIALAFNLYNGYPADVSDTLFVLDEGNFEIAMNAMRMRFDKGAEQ